MTDIAERLREEARDWKCGPVVLEAADICQSLIEEADNAAGLFKAMVVTHAEYMNADQRQLLNDTAASLRAAVAKARN